MNPLLIKFFRWYNGLGQRQQWATIIGGILLVAIMVTWVTREPSKRPRQPRIILDCYEGCGVNPERTISYNEYMDRKKQQQRMQFREDKQRIRQEIWDDNGRDRWCRNHPNDTNCKKK
jgi:hypothetical protein